MQYLLWKCVVFLIPPRVDLALLCNLLCRRSVCLCRPLWRSLQHTHDCLYMFWLAFQDFLTYLLYSAALAAPAAQFLLCHVVLSSVTLQTYVFFQGCTCQILDVNLMYWCAPSTFPPASFRECTSRQDYTYCFCMCPNNAIFRLVYSLTSMLLFVLLWHSTHPYCRQHSTIVKIYAALSPIILFAIFISMLLLTLLFAQNKFWLAVTALRWVYTANFV